MKKLLLLALFCSNVFAAPIMICNGEYALCAASGSTPTGKMITVKGKKFQEGLAICPVLTGRSIANPNLMNSSCDAPPGKVWSLYSTVSEAPQAPSWAVAPMVQRTFVSSKTEGMSNQWSFLCEKQAKPVNGVQLASCYGPINESPVTNGHVKPGSKVITDAPIGALNPVGGNF
jgi:hypothetical protein